MKFWAFIIKNRRKLWSGILYLVATPIGNLEDITLRAIRILKQVDLIAAEDTRHTLKLLNHFEISKPLISYHRHNEEIKVEGLIQRLLKGENIALVSDAGTPIISDPGDVIVKEAIAHEIKVVPIPGPCALITGLIASGADSKEFSFFGFLPLNKKTRKIKLEEIAEERKTVILYEAPHKLLTTLADLEAYIGGREVVLAKELTKIHENYIRGTVEEILEMNLSPKGEYVILIGKKESSEKEIKTNQNMTLEEEYNFYQKQGYEKKEIIKRIAKNRGTNKNEIYQHFLEK